MHAAWRFVTLNLASPGEERSAAKQNKLRVCIYSE